MAHLTLASSAGTASAQPLGNLVDTYGKSRSFLTVGWFLAALCAGVGALVLWTTTRIGRDFHYDGNVATLYGAGFGALALGALIAFLFWRLAASQPTFHLHQHGIRAVHGGSDHVTLYRDLEDLFVFPAGGIAYRAKPGAPWLFIASRIHDYAQLCRNLRSLQLEHRGEVLERRLEAGLPVVFRYVDDRVVRSKSAFATRNMDFPTHDLVLTRERLQVGEHGIALDRIQRIDTNLWFENARIMDVDGKVFFKVHPSAILSFDLLHYLIARRQELAGGVGRH